MKIEVERDTIYLDGRPIAVFLPGLSDKERSSAEVALGLRVPEGVVR